MASSYKELIRKANERSGSQPATNTGGNPSYADLLKQANQRRFDNAVRNVDDSYISTFENAANDFRSTSQTAYEGMNWGNAYQMSANRRNALEDLDFRQNVIRSWLEKNKSSIGDDRYRSVTDVLDAYNKDSTRIMSTFDDAVKFYSQWKTEDSYNKDAKNIEYQRKYQGKTYDAIQRILADMDDGEEKKWLRSNQYGFAKNNTDFNGFSRYSSTALDGKLEKMWSKYGMGYGDLTYEYINNQNGIRDEIRRKSSVYSADTKNAPSFVKNNYDQMTSDEVSIYNYYYSKYGKEKAEDYLYSIESTLEARANGETVKNFSSFADKHPYLASAVSVGTSVGSGAEYLGDILEYGKDVVKHGKDAQMGENELSLMTNAVRGTVMDKVDWEIGNWDAFDFLYGNAMSGVDSLVASMAPGKIGGFALGISAAAQGTNDALQRGMSSGQAFWNGLFNGVFEWLFESLSIGNFKSLQEVAPDSIKTIFKNLSKSMLVNATEEMATEIANIGYDTLINGEFANYTKEDLKNGKWKDAVLQVLEAGAGGALMGVEFAGIGNAIGYFSGRKRDTSALSNETDTEEKSTPMPENTNADNVEAVTEESSAVSDKMSATESTVTKSSGKNESSSVKVGVSKMEAVQQTADIDSFAQQFGTQANAVRRNYMDGQNLQEYELGFEAAYTIGRDGGKAEALNNGSFPGLKYLSQSQREIAFMLGRDAAAAQNAVEQETAQTESYKDTSLTNPASSSDANAVAEGKFTSKNNTEQRAASEFTEDGKTVFINTGEEVTVKEIASKKDGQFQLRLEDGRTVDADNVSFGSQDLAVVYDAMAQMDINPSAADILVKNYNQDGELSGAEYAQQVKNAYRFGQYRFPEIELSRSDMTNRLSEHQRNQAYKLGKVFAETTAKQKETNIRQKQASAKSQKSSDTVSKKASVGKTEAVGKVHFDRKGRTFSDAQETGLKTMEQLSRLLGVEFHVFESYEKDGKRVYLDENGVEKSAPNGWYEPDTGRIYIDLNAGLKADGTILFTVSHELTHFIRQWSPVKFDTLAEAVFKMAYEKKNINVSELVREQQAKALRNNRDISFDEAYEEVVADSMESILTSGKVLEFMAEVKQQDKSLWQKIKEWFKDLAEDIRKIVKAYEGYKPDSPEGRAVASMEGILPILEGFYEDALLDAAENYKGDIEVQSDESNFGIIRYSEKSFSEQVDEVISHTFDRSNAIYVGNTPKILGDIGLNRNLPMLTTASHIRKSMMKKDTKKHQHGLTESQVKSLPEKLAHPVMVLDSLNEKSNSIVVVTDMIDAEGSPIIATVMADGKGMYNNVEIDTNFVTSYYGRDGFAKFVENNVRADNFLYINKEKATTLSTGSSTQWLEQLEGYDFNTIIRNTRANVKNNGSEVNQKFSDRDSDGRTLTEEQKSYFSNSKVRDNDGNLLVMYHGTPNGDFTKFRSGSYFTQNPEYAALYQNPGASMLRVKKNAESPKNYQVYLNIENPFDTRNRKERRIFMQEYYRQLGTGAPLSDSGLPDWTDGIDLQEFIEEMGYDYDGLILDEGATGGYGEEVKSRGLSYVVFSPEQVKNVDNITPTDDPDIRYSDRDSNGRTLTEEQQFKRWFGNSKVINSDGTPKVVYHQTSYDFTIFDPKHEGAGSRDSDTPFGIFMKSSDKDIGLKGGKQMALYARITNPLIVQNRQELINKLTVISKDYKQAYEDIQKLNADFQRKFDDAKEAWRNYMIEWRKENPDASRTALYEDERFNRLFNAEDDVLDEWETEARKIETRSKEAITRDIESNGYDGIIIREDKGSFGRSTDAYIALHPEQVKSATENIGTFDAQNPDIRYSDRDPLQEKAVQALRKENDKLREDVSNLKEMVKLQKKVTGGKMMKPSSVEAAARVLKKSADATGDTKELAKLLGDFYSYIANGEELTWEGVKEAAKPAADWLWKNRKHTIDEYSAEILKELRTRGISFSEDQKSEAAMTHDTFANYRKSLFGSVKITNDGMPLDEAWHELSGMYPDVFSEDTNSSDMPRELVDIVDRLRSSDGTYIGYDEIMARQSLIRDVYDSYWNVSTLYTFADAKQKEISALKSRHAQRMSDLRTKHRERVKQLKLEKRDAVGAVRAAERQRYQERTKKIQDKYRENQKQVAANRAERIEKTEVRRKIRKTVMELNKLLIHGNKKKNIKEGMKDFAATALASAEILFSDNISNDDMLLNGIETQVDAKENRLIEETLALLQKRKDLYNLDASAQEFDDVVFTGSSDSYAMRMEESQKLDRKISEKMRKLESVFERERNRLNEATVSGILENLAEAYKDLGSSDALYIRSATDERVYQHLMQLKDKIGGATVRDMTVEQLKAVSDAYTMVLTTIRNANKAFTDGRSIQADAEQMASEFKSRKLPDKKLGIAAKRLLDSVGWNYEKLHYALDRIDSPTLSKLFGKLADSENITMRDVQEAKAYQLEMVEKYHYNDWKNNQKMDHDFVDNTGKEFRLTLGELMALYAYSRREGADRHIEYGGFTFKETALTDPNPASTYKLTAAQLKKITGMLTQEQRAFAEAMQKYLSETMGDKGNEVSMKLYGIKLFAEEIYFPLHIAGEFKAQAQESQAKAAAGFQSMSNAGFTQARNKDSIAPIVLEDFMTVWADHVNEMSRYHGAVPALEDIRRVMNYSVYNDSANESMSVEAAMTNAFGKQAVRYFDNLYREANSGAITDRLDAPQKKMLSLFRKNAVAYSLSVIIQQPASIYRARMEVDRKYFGRHGFFTLTGAGLRIFNRKKWNESYSEMMKYAPGVSMAKEIGGFDTSTGNSIRSYLLDTGKSFVQSMKNDTLKYKAKSVMDLVDNNPVANLPNVMDKVAWIEMWEACKRETVAKNPNMRPGSEAFLQKVGQRFTEVIRATQVYDSMFSKSPMLKTKNLFVQSAVSFMNEPNTVANMAEAAIRDMTRGNWKKAGKTGAALVTSIVATNLLKSLVYAIRDDDEDETLLEKYVSAVAGSLIDDVTVFNYIPFARDVWSVVQGYDVERADMAIVSDAVNAVRRLVKMSDKDTASMTEEELEAWDREVTDCQWAVVETLSPLFRIPLKNIRRDILAVFNAVKIIGLDKGRESTVLSIQHAVEDAIWKGSKSAGDRLYEALVSGDSEYAKRLRDNYKNDNAYHTSARNGLRDHDSRIWEAAVAWNSNDMETYFRIAKEIKGEKHFIQDDIVLAIRAEANAMAEKNQSSSGKVNGYFTNEKLGAAMGQNNVSMADTIRKDLIDTAVANGKSREDAEESVRSTARTQLKELYANGSITEANTEKMLVKYGGMETEEAKARTKAWGWMNQNPNSEATVEQVEAYQRPLEGLDRSVADMGIGMDIYLNEKKAVDSFTSDKDENGKTIAYSRINKAFPYINRLNLTREQKTALAVACGWSYKTVMENKLW